MREHPHHYEAPAAHAERHQRFALLRSLIYDEGRRHRVLLIGSLIAVALVVALTVLARLYTVFPLDVWFSRGLQSSDFSLVTQVMYWVSLPGYAPWSAVAVAAGTLVVGVWLGWRDGLFLLLATLGQGLLNALIKRAIGRPRPLDSVVEVFSPAQGFSFPSGHVMFYTVFFGLLLFLVLVRMHRTPARTLLAAACAMMILLVGPSRIILGAHWLSDVLAAYLLGLVILAGAIEAYLHYLAPPSPAQQGGLVRSLDEGS